MSKSKKIVGVPLTNPFQQDDPRVNVDLCQQSGTAQQCFPSWIVLKKALPPIPFNAGSGEHPTAEFQVTITRPPQTLTVCWNIQFTISNHTGGPITLLALDATLKQLAVPISTDLAHHEIPLPLNPNLDNERAVCIIFSQCDAVDLSSCIEGASYVVDVEVKYQCGSEQVIKIFEDLPLALPKDTLLNCEDPSQYVLTELSTCDNVPLSQVLITAIDPPVPSCPDLQAIANSLSLHIPVPLAPDQGVLLSPECFPATQPQQLGFTIKAVCPEAPASCPGPTITNTATITKVTSLVSIPPCPPNSEPVKTFIQGNVCISTLACDSNSASDTSTPPCVGPQICVTTTVNCRQQICFCKTSTVLSQTQIQYDVTFTLIPSEVCIFTPTFYLVADAGNYTAELTLPDGTMITVPFVNDGSCTNLTREGLPCNTCQDNVAPINCPGVNLGPIDFGIIPPETTQIGPLIIKDSQGNVVTSTLICVPSKGPVCVGECINLICSAGNGSCGFDCTFIPSESSVTVTEPADICVRAQLLAVLIGKDNVTFPQSCEAINGTPTANGILQCSATQGEPLLSKISDDILTALEDFGLHYIITIPNTCCAPVGSGLCLTVQNTFRLMTGSEDCSGAAPSSCSLTGPPAVSDRTQSLFDTVKLRKCTPAAISKKKR